MSNLTFKPKEKLKSRKIIATLFKEGSAVSAYPLRAIWKRVEKAPSSAYPACFALSVPKRAFSKAADRNVLRRKIREAYRLHKHLFYQQLSADPHDTDQVAFMVIYLAKTPLSFAEIEKSMINLLDKLAKDFLAD